jgi:xanthine dehydrogenase accessory factor
MFEYINTQTPKLVVFGAGHVTHSLAKILTELPCHLMVVDSRTEWLESLQAEGIHTECRADPAEIIESLPENAYVVVMTHDHGIDYAVVKKALEQHCFPFIGLIGSASKKERFIRRLKDDLSDASLISQLTCPVGNPDVPGKLPMQVAVSISAQLIKLFEGHSLNQTNNSDRKAQLWEATNQIRKALSQADH